MYVCVCVEGEFPPILGEEVVGGSTEHSTSKGVPLAGILQLEVYKTSLQLITHSPQVDPFLSKIFS